MNDAQIQKIKNDAAFVENTFKKLLPMLPQFEVANAEALPDGLKKHTRSVSWIAEQVIVQNAKAKASQLGLSRVEYNFEDTSLYDFEMEAETQTFRVNVKTHNTEGENCRNDIAAAKKLKEAYERDSSLDLLYCCIGIRFDGRKVNFDSGYLKIFPIQFLPDDFYINYANWKIQEYYSHNPVERSRPDFLILLSQKIKEAEKRKKEKSSIREISAIQKQINEAHKKGDAEKVNLLINQLKVAGENLSNQGE